MKIIRKNYIYNDSPKFIPIHKKVQSSFILYAMKKAINTDVARNKLKKNIFSKHFEPKNISFRLRRLNEHRARAMRAIVQAMLYHFNIVSQIVEASIEQLSDECGLSTISAAGNKSITRASRLISEFMEPMGFIICIKKSSRLIHHYAPKKIFLTPLFFMLIKIKKEEINNFLNAQIKKNELNYNYDKKNKMSLIQIKQICTLDEKKAKKKILYTIINNFSTQELTKLGSRGLKRMVNAEYSKLKKIIKIINSTSI